MGRKKKVGVIGCGAIGSGVARFIDQELKDKLELVGICDRTSTKVNSLLAVLSQKPKIFNDYCELIKEAELIVETASIDCARDVITEGVKRNKDLVILSVGAFVKYKNLYTLLKDYKGNLYIPSGAICGVDGLGSLKRAHIKELVLTTSKPPGSLGEISFLEEEGIDTFSLRREQILFQGSIEEAIERFPQNINVAATIFLATQFPNASVVVKVDPHLRRNSHKIELKGEEANIKIEVENVPSLSNPKTSYLAILSVQSLLEKITSNIKIGS
ncbi:MAG: hypothetical protein B6D55_03560 [Candidatus Omnitrophica bacterium 4484_70.2]|nr:MAG: hypothetical protein B6D55_03560 [Candidatus Omnitrophica bacterium 4484_70.2]